MGMGQRDVGRGVVTVQHLALLKDVVDAQMHIRQPRADKYLARKMAEKPALQISAIGRIKLCHNARAVGAGGDEALERRRIA